MNKQLITREQYNYLVSLLPNSVDAKSYLDSYFAVYYTPDQLEVFINVNERLEETFNTTRLGSLSEQFRVATNPEVPGVRGLGHRFSSVYFDEAHFTEVAQPRRRHSDDASEWLEHRSFCKRDLLSCLSGEAC